MKEDAELAQRVRLLLADNLAKAVPPALPPELELRSLRRTQSLLGWQRLALWFRDIFSPPCYSAMNSRSKVVTQGISPAARLSGGVRNLRGTRPRLLDRLLLHPPPFAYLRNGDLCSTNIGKIPAQFGRAAV